MFLVDYNSVNIDDLAKDLLAKIEHETSEDQNTKIVRFGLHYLELFDDKIFLCNYLIDKVNFTHKMENQQFANLISMIYENANFHFNNEALGFDEQYPEKHSRLSTEKAIKLYMNYINLMKYALLTFGSSDSLTYTAKQMVKSQYNPLFIIVLCDLLSNCQDTVSEYQQLSKSISEDNRIEIYSNILTL